MSDLRASARKSCCAFALTLLLAGGSTPAAEARQEPGRLRFPTEPNALVLKLDVGAQRNLVRVYGDGRVVVVQGLNETRQELWLDRAELGARIDSIITSGLAGLDEASLEARISEQLRGRRGLFLVTDTVGSTVEMQLLGFGDAEDGARAEGKPSHKTLRWPPGVSTENFSEISGTEGSLVVRAFAETLDWLHQLSRHESLVTVTVEADVQASPAELSASIIFRTPKNEWIKLSVDGQETLLGLGQSRGQVWVSPDGKQIALRDRELTLLDVATGQRTPYQPGAQSGHSVLWSPDGQSTVASLHLGDLYYHLFLRPTDGGEARALTDVGSLPLAWAPDSSRIYYVANEKPSRVRRQGEPPLPVERNVYVIHPDGSGRRRIAVDGGVIPSQLSFSASQELVAFTDDGLPRRLFVAPVDTTTGDLGTTREIARDVFFFDWSPIDDRLVFDSYGIDSSGRAIESLDGDDDGGSKLLIHTMNSAQPHVLREIEGGVWLLLRPRWSPDGQQVMFLRVPPIDGVYHHDDPRTASNGEICVVNADGSGFRVIARQGGDPTWVQP